MSGPFGAAFLRRRLGLRRVRTLGRRVGRPRRGHHHASGVARRAGSERRRHARSRRRGSQAHRARSKRPHHRRAAAAADPDLVGPLAAAAARDHRSGAYRLGWAFERVEQDGRGVRVRFNGGRVGKADILVGGDGIRSTVRGEVAPELQPNYVGYYIWRGSPDEADVAPKTLKEIFPYFCFYLPPRQGIITYPISGFKRPAPRPPPLRFIWYRGPTPKAPAR